jgi:hypothetical protein
VASPASVLYVELVMSIDRIGDAARVAPVRQGEWPPAVVVAHLADVDEQVWLPRVEEMVAAFDTTAALPHFSWWEPDPVATLERYRSMSVDDAVARAMAARIAMITRLRHLTTEQWAGARGQHDVFGEMDVEAVVLATLGHDEEHRASFVFA